jgi:hypothetical protein
LNLGHFQQGLGKQDVDEFSGSESNVKIEYLNNSLEVGKTRANGHG